MIVYYYGADHPWVNQNESSLNRRNMAYLLALANNTKITKVFNVIRCTRQLALNKSAQKVSKHPKIENLYFAPILPERGVLKPLQFVNRALNKLLNSKQFTTSSHPVINWCYWPKAYQDFKYLNTSGQLVFDSDHNLINDPNRKDKDQDRIKLLERIAKEANYVISGSRSMLDWFKLKGDSRLILGMNGSAITTCFSEENFRREKKIEDVVYCGTLSPWIKKEWLLHIIERHPELKFHIIGNDYNCNLSEDLAKYKNVILYGFLKLPDAKKIILKADVAIALYDESKGIDGSSMKFFDYLTLNKKIVTNRFHEHISGDFKDLLCVANTFEEFENYITDITIEKPSEHSINDFLNANTWDNIIDNILVSIEK